MPLTNSSTPSLLLLALAGCPTPDTTEPDEPFVPTIPTSECGLDYEWQSAERMGEIVAFEHLPENSLSADGINALLNTFDLDMFTPVPYGIEVYRVRYLTQDRGELIEATGLIAYPAVTEAQSFPSMVWIRPTVGFEDTCAPSGRDQLERIGFTLWASFGYAVVAPDLLGMNGWGEPSTFTHPYIVPEPTAIASLDSLRAMWRLRTDTPQLGILAEPEARTVLWGVSEGGFGALWADRYASGYAPEVDVVAVVAAVPPTRLTALTTGGLTTFQDATHGVVPVLATSHQWYRGTEPLTDVFTDTAPSNVASRIEASLDSSCIAPDNPLDDTNAVLDVFTESFTTSVLANDWDAVTPWSCYLAAGDLAESAIPRGSTAPVLYIVAENDELVLGSVGREDAPRLCASGYEQLEYLECAGASHVEGGAKTVPYQLDWIAARIDNTPLEDPCKITAPIDCDVFGLEL